VNETRSILRDKAVMETAYNAPPVQRACHLLRAIADGETVSNISKAATALGINRTTLLRLLHTLEAERFIERLPDGTGYRIGLGLVGLVAKSSYSKDLMQEAMPVLARLADNTGLSAHLGLLDGAEALYISRQAPDAPLASTIRTGHRIPAHATTLGRIILAYMPRAAVDALYASVPLARFTDRTPAKLDELHALLARERASGVATSESYYVEGVSSLAAAIFDERGEVVAAVNVAGPSFLFDNAPGRKAILTDAVRAAAHEISERLGFQAGWTRSTAHVA
jgi:DNA-binding IclR family transcriptional regulator